MRTLLRATLIVGAVLLVLSGCGPSKDSLKSAGQVLAVHWENGSLPYNPLDRAWESLPVHNSPMKLQDVVEPRMSTPGVTSVDVRAVYDAKELIVRLDWPDSTADTVTYTAKFGDAVAIQFPVVPGTVVPDANMGQAGGAVQIYQWKAFWQTKLAMTESITKTLFPNSHIDFYPSEAAKDSNSRQELEKVYEPAWNAGNPVAHRSRAVQAYVAEGFGTLTARHDDAVDGRGIWQKGRWYVTLNITLPEPNSDSALQPAQRTFIALAVWDGSSGNVGARKMRTTWIPFMMRGATE